MPASKIRRLIAAELFGIGCAAVLAFAVAGSADWDLALFASLLALSIVSEISAVSAPSSIKISGSFLALVLAMVFLGGAPAAVIGAATICVGWIRWREAVSDFVNNLFAYVWFPLVGGIAFHAVAVATGVTQEDLLFYMLVFATFLQVTDGQIVSHRPYWDLAGFMAQLTG